MQAHGMAGHAIRRLHQISTQTFARHMQAAGIDLTSVQFAAMDAIATHPGTDQAGIATLIAYDRATIGGVIDRLVQKGYVSRSIARHDRRARELVLTESGTNTLKQVLPVVTALQDDILAGLSPKERDTFTALATKAVRLSESAT